MINGFLICKSLKFAYARNMFQCLHYLLPKYVKEHCLPEIPLQNFERKRSHNDVIKGVADEFQFRLKKAQEVQTYSYHPICGYIMNQTVI